MDIKNNVIETVVINMAAKLDSDEIQLLRNTMIQCFYDVEIVKKETELAIKTADELNDYYLRKFCMHKKVKIWQIHL